VLLARKREAAVAFYVADMPLDLAVVGIVDTVDLTRLTLEMDLHEGYNQF
jgi:microcompartment protein CcmK/EutM